VTALLGCFGLLLVVGLLIGEAFSFSVVHQLLGAHARELIGGVRWTDTLLPILVLQGVVMVVGWLVAKSAVAALPLAMMSSLMGPSVGLGTTSIAGGKLMVRLLAGILLIVPGFFLDVVAVLLLLPPVTAIFGSLGQRVALSLVRRQMGRMGVGGAMGGGMPFPGMRPRGQLTPDARVGRSGKIVDVTAERVDPADKG